MVAVGDSTAKGIDNQPVCVALVEGATLFCRRYWIFTWGFANPSKKSLRFCKITHCLTYTLRVIYKTRV